MAPMSTSVARLRRTVRRSPLTKASDLLGRQRHETIGHGIFHQHPFGSNADLTAARESAPDGGARRARKVGVGQHDHGRLAPELEHDGNPPGGGRARHLAPHRRRCP